MKLTMSPIDTWFFRDSTPFDMEATSQSGVVGVFPPFPPTIAGAVRAALARENGWDGRGRWSADVAEVLGDGPDNLGKVQFTGPVVLRSGVPLFPMPRHVMGRPAADGRWAPVALLQPGVAGIASDLGEQARLPELEARPTGDVPLEGGVEYWVTLAGLQGILAGALPSAGEIVHEDELWTEEGRVGIARNEKSRTVSDGMLYSTLHVRPSAHVGLGVEVTGVPDMWRSPAGGLIPLGGESRLAACEAWEGSVSFTLPENGPAIAALIALTPLLLDARVACGADPVAPGVRIVCACTDRPLRIGGWDSGQRAPRPLRNALASGSVLFCELEDPGSFWKTIKNGLARIGAVTTMGFGLCAAGHAPHWEKTT